MLEEIRGRWWTCANVDMLQEGTKGVVLSFSSSPSSSSIVNNKHSYLFLCAIHEHGTIWRVKKQVPGQKAHSIKETKREAEKGDGGKEYATTYAHLHRPCYSEVWGSVGSETRIVGRGAVPGIMDIKGKTHLRKSTSLNGWGQQRWMSKGQTKDS